MLRPCCSIASSFSVRFLSGIGESGPTALHRIADRVADFDRAWDGAKASSPSTTSFTAGIAILLDRTVPTGHLIGLSDMPAAALVGVDQDHVHGHGRGCFTKVSISLCPPPGRHACCRYSEGEFWARPDPIVRVFLLSFLGECPTFCMTPPKGIIIILSHL